jgi:hypothetical protein
LFIEKAIMMPNKNEATVNKVPIVSSEPGPGKKIAIRTNRKKKTITNLKVFIFFNILQDLLYTGSKIVSAGL